MLALILICLGVLALLYGVAIMLIWSGTLFFAVWYVLGAALIAVGALVKKGVWIQLPTLVRLATYAAALTLTAVVAIGCTLIVAQAHSAPPANLDAVVVLGAQVYKSKTPSPVLRYRLNAAADYLKQNPNTLVVVSGGQGFNEPCPEAEVMSAYLEQQGIDPSRIIEEPASTNTVENIKFSTELLTKQTQKTAQELSVGIVTNNFHCFRAGRIAQKQGITNSCTIAAYSNPLYFPNNALRECLGIAKDALAHNI